MTLAPREIRARVFALLESLDIPYALIGAIAVAARGAPRSTFDFDLLTVDRAVLKPEVWSGLRAEGVPVDVRRGEFDDPLAGVVRIGGPPESVDLVVGRNRWEKEVIERAETVEIDGFRLRLPLTSDLILLKLAAGGPLDRQDIIRLLDYGPREHLIAEVNERIGALADDARELWEEVVGETE